MMKTEKTSRTDDRGSLTDEESPGFAGQDAG